MGPGLPKSGTIKPVLPTVQEPEPKLSVVLNITQAEDPWEPGTAQVTISNKLGAGPALWIDLDKFPCLSEPWVQFATPPQRIMRVDAGSHSLPRREFVSQEDRVCLCPDRELLVYGLYQVLDTNHDVTASPS